MNMLRKSFKFQKVMFYIYMIFLIACFIFAISFMTQYSNLFGLELPMNDGVTAFHSSMQKFDRNIIFFSLASIVSIIFMFALEVHKKVVDKFAFVIMSLLILWELFICVYGIINMANLMTSYKGVDFQYLYLEDPALENYQLKFETFYIGYIIYILTIISSVLFLISIVLSHILYLKQNKNNHDEIVSSLS